MAHRHDPGLAVERIEHRLDQDEVGSAFNQRGGLGPATVIAEFDGNGLPTNLQSMSASELYRAGFVTNGRSPRR